jgi:hypothetical protein
LTCGQTSSYPIKLPMSSTPADRRKGSRKLAPASKKTLKRRPLSTPEPTNPSDLQPSKDLLTLFHRTFSDLFANPNLHDLLQTVKHHLYNRDYAQAFGTPRAPPSLRDPLVLQPRALLPHRLPRSLSRAPRGLRCRLPSARNNDGGSVYRRRGGSGTRRRRRGGQNAALQR